MKITHVLALCMVVICSIWTTTPAFADESYAVICYVGDPSDNHTAGEVEVFDTRSAAAVCNTSYYDCRGNCTGCFIGSDGFAVCVDSRGRQFQR